MAAAVLLLHELPDGSSHFDWLIQRPEGSDAPLASFRVGCRIDSGSVAEFGAEAIPDHRPLYLEYEGPVPGGRGKVRRVATGRLEIVTDEPGRFAVRGRLGAAEGDFSGRVLSDGRWLFGFVARSKSVG